VTDDGKKSGSQGLCKENGSMQLIGERSNSPSRDKPFEFEEVKKGDPTLKGCERFLGPRNVSGRKAAEEQNFELFHLSAKKPASVGQE